MIATIFHIDGGLGKHIVATAIAEVIKKANPKAKLYIICAYPDVFKHNPFVYKTIKIGEHGNFYENVVKGNENLIKIYYADPYTHSDFILKQDHLLNIWANQYGLTYKGERPNIYLTKSELEYFKPFYNIEKPILVIQPNGGYVGQGYNYSWTRDIPETTVLRVIEEFKDTHTIVHIKRKDQKTYPNTLHALDGFRSIAVLLQLSDKRLLIDSFTQHLAAAFNLPSTVCWVLTQPEVLGYRLHNNIKANKFTLQADYSNKLYEPFALSEDITTCPYGDLRQVFNDNQIIKSLKNDTTNLEL